MTLTPLDSIDDAGPARLLSRQYLPTAGGAIGLVTLGAFENRAVMTVLPVAAADLGGFAWFGLASAAAMVTLLVATALGGILTDRRGPRGIIVSGLVLFVVAQVVTGLAPTMIVVTAGRVLSGAAEGLLDVGLVVLLAKALPAELRAKVMAAFATAWILPSLLGPAVAGGISDLWGWRIAFLLPLLLVVPTTLMLVGAFREVGHVEVATTPWTDEERTTMRSAVIAAVALSAVTIGSGTVAGSRVALAVTTLLGGAILLVFTIRSLLPAGSMRFRRGVPAVVAQRLLLTAAFTSGSAFIPLMLTTVHDASATEAGVSLTVTGIFWAVGSQLVSLRRMQRVRPARRHATGMVLVAIGLLGPTALSLDLVSTTVGMCAWACAATGIGMSSNTLATQLLDLSDDTAQGRNNAAATLASSIGAGLAMAFGGTLVAARADDLSGSPFAVLMLVAVAMAAVGSLAAGRIEAAR